MFSFFRNPPSNKISVKGIEAEVVMILRSGKVLMTSQSVQRYPKDNFDGAIFEVMLEVAIGDPYFVYYKCDEYYMAVQGLVALGAAQHFEEWRTAVSVECARFLTSFMYFEHKQKIQNDLVSFSHNSKHTNVLAYVESLGDWYPIHHNDQEGDDASEIKVALINQKKRNIREFISTREASPS